MEVLATYFMQVCVYVTWHDIMLQLSTNYNFVY